MYPARQPGRQDLAYISRVSGRFQLMAMIWRASSSDLDGRQRDESPSFAPNGGSFYMRRTWTTAECSPQYRATAASNSGWDPGGGCARAVLGAFLGTDGRDGSPSRRHLGSSAGETLCFLEHSKGVVMKKTLFSL